jgi:hypothetical protein
MSKVMEPGVARSNANQVRQWDGEHGDYWAQYADLYDHSLAGYQPGLLAAAHPPRETGSWTSDAAPADSRPTWSARHPECAHSGSTSPLLSSPWRATVGPD